ncbi:MAG: Fic family protein [Clostridiales bacterium]|nr:Fic family protein [Clostridiales bacterium]
MENRAGKYVSNLTGDLEYRSFCPAALPPDPALKLDSEMTELLVEAHSQLSLLEGLTSRIPDMSLFVSMYVRKEALLSSQIEGTQATLDDVLDPLRDENANLDVSDVVNYIRATDYATGRLETLPLCNRLLRETHAVLMENVRGQDKEPGEFRHSQNWIGGQGSSLRNARYIPPNTEDMEAALYDLEQFINGEDNLDELTRIALIHYQFETIHPFLDGNGRVGRLMIPLYLMERKVLTSPALYISCYLKQNRIEYYDRMSEVRRSGNYEQWVKFFLRAVAASSGDAVKTIDKLSECHKQSVQAIGEHYSGKIKNTAMLFFNYLEQSPIIEIGKTAQSLEMAYNTAARYVRDFCEMGILAEREKSGKTRIFSYENYLDILRKDT